MLAIIREIGIFIVIAQAVLFFVPGETYVKYVKVIVGIIFILKLSEPVLSLITGGEWEAIVEQAIADSEQYGFGAHLPETADGSAKIYREIEEEIKRRLQEETPEEYEIRKVRLKEKAGREGIYTGIVITVLQKQETQDSADYLKEHYGRLLGMEASDVEIETVGRG